MKESPNGFKVSFDVGSVECVSGSTMIGKFCLAVKESGQPQLAETLILLASDIVPSSDLNAQWLRVSEVTALKRKTPKQKRVQELASRATALVRNRGYHTGASKLDDFNAFWIWCEENTLSHHEWIRTKEARELQVNFEEEMKSVTESTEVPSLIVRAQAISSRLVKSEAESTKMAFLLGRIVFFIRRNGAQTWNEVADQVGFGLTRRSLMRYQELFEFLNDYPRFLRTRISYTALLKYSKQIRKELESNHTKKTLWACLKD